MNIEPITHTDLPFLKPFQPPEWGDISPSLEYYTQHDFCHPIKIVENGSIIGIGCTILFEDTAWLAHIITHPSHRSKGIGTFITQTLIDRIPVEYETIYLIATDLGEPVYTKLGFETETEYAFLKGGGIEDDSEISPNIILYEPKYKNEILELDKLISGESRIKLLEKDLPNARLYISNNKLEGFYMPTLREGFIAAIDYDAGIELLKLRLKVQEVCILPVDNVAAIVFLEKHNYSEFRDAKRMRLGKERAVQLNCYYNRISGQFG